MKLSLAAALFVTSLALPAQAASVSKSYSYFNISGHTLDEIQAELDRRGPQLKSTGRRHPGATLMEFKTRLGYGKRGKRCEIVEAHVQLKAKVILPRWRTRGRTTGDTKLIWNTLSADIKRHEESHVVIAKNHARELEKALMAIGVQPSCDAAKIRAKEVSKRVLTKHDAAQAKFDRIEGINFERRILRLLEYRSQRTASGN